MDDKDDSAWVFDSLVGFLQGPIWSAPLLTFIEEKSLIFDSDTEDSEEYRQIYQEYKNLVDLLLGCYMEDMGITPEQFEHACTVNKNTKMPIQFQQSLFEQIWAANEYEIFKRMMIQKNLELQLQALSLIEQKFGLTPASLMCESDLHDELVIEELLHERCALEDEAVEVASEMESDRAIRIEHERLATQYKAERQLLQKALRESTSSLSSNTHEVEGHQIEQVVRMEPAQLTSKVLESKKFGILEPIPRKEKKLNKEVEQNKEEKENSNPPSAVSGAQANETAEEEIKKRQIYLKSQRDKLVLMKKEARSQQLKTNAVRPGSAKVLAEASMMGKEDFNTSQLLEPSTIQVRKALAARLKAEVVRK